MAEFSASQITATPESKGVFSASQITKPQASAVERFGKGLYDTTAGPIVQTVTHPIDTAANLFNVPKLKEIAKHIQEGNYGHAAASILQYGISNPASRMGEGMVNDVVHDASEGNLAGAGGRVVGDALMLAGPKLGEMAAGTRAGRAVTAGVKAAAPELGTAAALAAAGEALAQVPGMAYPAHVAMAYPAAKAISSGLKKGLTAGKNAYADVGRERALAAEAAKIPPDVLAELTRESGVPEPPVAEPAQAAVPQGQPIPGVRPQWEDAAAIERLRQEQAARAVAPPVDAVNPPETQGLKAVEPVKPPVSASTVDQLANMTAEQMKAAGLTPEKIGEMLHREMRQSGTIEDAPPPPANPFEGKARAKKVANLADALNDAGQGYARLSELKAPELKATIQAAAKLIGENEFSDASIADLMEQLKDMKPPKAAAAGRGKQ